MQEFTLPKRSDPPRENCLYPELFALHSEVQALAADTDDLKKLLDIQKRLLAAVIDAEKEIKAAKAAGVDPLEWQYVRYNFLCLGDALAFLYIDRFALKQTYFNVDNANAKQSGGFVSGKSGLDNELALLTEAIGHRVPAVLCDLTNVIRYGDVCLLGDIDPVPIEVKSSNKKDSRRNKQKKKLQALSNFIVNDRAENFRGLKGTTLRATLAATPRAFDGQIQQAVSEAITDGTSHFEVDSCLAFLIISDCEPDYDVLFASVTHGNGLIISINERKSSMDWGCYFPYSLTLSDTEHFSRFVKGEVHILAVLKLDAFEANLSTQDFSLKVEANEDSIRCQINFSDKGDIDYFFIGEHMMCRMWTDFLYPSWIVENMVQTLLDNLPKFEEEATPRR